MIQRTALSLGLCCSLASAVTVSKIEIKGYNDADKIKSALGIAKGDTYTEAKVERAKMAIIASLESQGYRDNVVESSVRPSDGKVKVRFDVNRGEKIEIVRVNFVGNSSLSDETLKSNLVNKESDLIGWFPGLSNGDANVQQLKYDGYRVRDTYLKNGYMDVRVSEPLMRVDTSSYTAEVSYTIQEGASYTVSAISIPTNIAGLDREELSDELELESGKLFNVEKLREDITMIKETVGNLGYAYAEVKPDFEKNAQNRTVAVRYNVIPGNKVKIGNVKIIGNDKTKDHVVRRYIYQTPGDTFNQTDFEDSQKELSRTGYFEKATVTKKRRDSDTVDLLVNVREAKTGSISAGGGYSSSDGFLVTGSYGEKNMFGTGIAMNTSIDYSEIKHSYSTSFSDPRVFDSQFSLAGGIFKNNTDYTGNTHYNNLGYLKKEELGGYLSVGRKLTRTLSASVGYSYSDTDYGDITGTATDYKDYVKSSLLSALVYNTTDNYYTPREGVYAKLNFEYAGFGTAPTGKEYAEYLKTNFKFATYYGFKDSMNFDLILRYKMRFGYMTSKAGDYVPRAEKLYLGGSQRGVRGFSNGSIAPVDSGGNLAGGSKSMVNSIEASLPISDAAKIRLTFFADHGMIGTDNIQDIQRKSVGAQIEWGSPFGPVNFILAKPINPELSDKTASFEFSMGAKF